MDPGGSQNSHIHIVPSTSKIPRVKDQANWTIPYYVERPMTLNVWTQTSNENLNNSDYDASSHEKQEKINDLTEKIRVLEEVIAKHNIPLPKCNKSLDVNLTKSLSHLRSPNNETNPVVINPLHCISKIVSPESVQYTIITEEQNYTVNEPIELNLDESNELNANQSAESGGMEICVVEEGKPINLVQTSEPSTTAKVNKTSGKQRIKVQDNLMPNSSTPVKGIRQSNGRRNAKEIRLSRKEEKQLQQQQQQQQKKFSSHDLLVPEILPSTERLNQFPGNLDDIWVCIGPNNTRILATVYNSMSWGSPSIATRKLLMTLFDRNTLATHSMTGKPSPAFINFKPAKEMLDPLVIKDIVYAVSHKCKVSEKEVRTAITTKCADENKMMKQKLKRRKNFTMNKENRP